MTLRSLILSAVAVGALSVSSAALAQTPAEAPAAAAPAAFANITPAPGQDIVGVLTASGQFGTFLKALEATGLTPVLKNPGLTVFAPTDAAFAALPAGQVDEWLKPDNLPTLQRALAYLIVNTKIDSAAAKNHQTKVATVAGADVWIDGFDGLKVNDAHVLQADVAASNGTIYVIDKMIAPGFTPPPPPEGAAVAEEPAPAAAATTTKTTKSTTTTKKKR
jgi:uncharacterized surface protein with fasciclin (FAS1) repeats